MSYVIVWVPAKVHCPLTPTIHTSWHWNNRKYCVADGDTSDFSGEQLIVLKEDVLVENDMFTDYTDEEGKV